MKVQRLWLLVVAAFLCGCQGQQPCRQVTNPSTYLRILTYNVLGSEHQDHLRQPALFKILQESQADIICLQEASRSLVSELQDQSWFQGHYHGPLYKGIDAIANGNYICARHPVLRVEKIQHPGPQGRESLVVHLRVHGRQLGVATCHLESMLEDGAIRARQLDQIFPLLAQDDDAILAGDFNFGDGEQPDSAHLDPQYQDLWLALRPTEPGYTWDIEKSAMARRGSFVGEPSRRLDRILLRSDYWRAQNIRILGNKALKEGEGRLFPSDHFALCGVVTSGS